MGPTIKSLQGRLCNIDIFKLTCTIPLAAPTTKLGTNDDTCIWWQLELLLIVRVYSRQHD